MVDPTTVFLDLPDAAFDHAARIGPLAWWLFASVGLGVSWHLHLRRHAVRHGPLLLLPVLLMLVGAVAPVHDGFQASLSASAYAHGADPTELMVYGWATSFVAVRATAATAAFQLAVATLFARGRTALSLLVLHLAALAATAAAHAEHRLWWSTVELSHRLHTADAPLLGQRGVDQALHHAALADLFTPAAIGLATLGLALLATVTPRRWSAGLVLLAALTTTAATHQGLRLAPAAVTRLDAWDPHAIDPSLPAHTLDLALDWHEWDTRHPLPLPTAPPRVQRAFAQALVLRHTNRPWELLRREGAWNAVPPVGPVAPLDTVPHVLSDAVMLDARRPPWRLLGAAGTTHPTTLDAVADELAARPLPAPLLIQPAPDWRIADLIELCAPLSDLGGPSPCLIVWEPR